jgi:hypothetical protein
VASVSLAVVAARLGVGRFFDEILRRMDVMMAVDSGRNDGVVERSSSPSLASTSSYFPSSSHSAKACLYGTHDTAILMFLIALGADGWPGGLSWPPFTANITFELLHDAGRGYLVRCRYMGDVVPLPCSTTVDGVATFEQFRQWISQHVPVDFTEESK